jgi:pimeloyl-[acyl-carrier protein] methyl ester esterase
MKPELVFAHGWGFDAHFWDDLRAHLPQYRHSCVERGFFGAPIVEPASGAGKILIGHSLGFVHGMNMQKNWQGWIAINGFPRFVEDGSHTGCIPPANLRRMKMRLQDNAAATLQDFYRQIGAAPVVGKPNVAWLGAGLDELRDLVFAELAVPGLVLASRNDPLVPPSASEALSRYAAENAPLWHESGGHILPQSDAGFCATAIADFLETFFA